MLVVSSEHPSICQCHFRTTMPRNKDRVVQMGMARTEWSGITFSSDFSSVALLMYPKKTFAISVRALLAHV